MIRINLLPHKRGRVSKKSIDFRNFLLATGAAMAVVVLGGGGLSWIMLNIASLNLALALGLKGNCFRLFRMRADNNLF